MYFYCFCYKFAKKGAFMIYSLKGKVVKTEENFVVLETPNGISWGVICSTPTVIAVSQETETITLLTYLQVREDALTLYGFSNQQEKELFQNLITVSGIGPKMAIQILSGISVQDFALSVLNGNVKTLSGVKGLGKKTAERIIVELREKMGELPNNTSLDFLSTPTTAKTSAMQEAEGVLISLGFKNEAEKLLKTYATPNMTAEEIIRACLQGAGK